MEFLTDAFLSLKIFSGRKGLLQEKSQR